MKVGVFTVLFAQRPFEEALDYIKAAGCDAVEIGCGGYPGTAHCVPSQLLADTKARDAFQSAVSSRSLEISAVNRDTVKLARARVNALPGSGGC
jgi:sugar phosphate isomerase/epimerase